MRGRRRVFNEGEVFGSLTIEKTWTVPRPNGRSKESICQCRCICGKVLETKGSYLVGGHKKSCGCLQFKTNQDHPSWKGCGEIPSSFWNGIINAATKSRARVIDFDLTIEEGWQLFLEQDRKCALTGVELTFHERDKRFKDAECTASLDRIDSSKGYFVKNVQWVHKDINIMKWSLPQDVFVEWCKRVALKMG